jgi:ribosomal protein L32
MPVESHFPLSHSNQYSAESACGHWRPPHLACFGCRMDPEENFVQGALVNETARATNIWEYTYDAADTLY